MEKNCYINISAGDDCPGEWRKAIQSDVSFCRVADDGYDTCSSANFSTNGTSRLEPNVPA